MNALTVLTVDDEPLSLLRLEQTLPSVPDVTHVGAAFSTAEAIEKIGALKPDIVLLDIQLRDGTGFDVVDGLPPNSATEIIFVTAFNEFATKAFDANVVDFVMKPVSATRLAAAIARARERIETRGAVLQVGALRALVQELKRSARDTEEGQDDTKFWIRTRGGDLASIHAGDIDWVRSEDDYVRLHTAFGEYLVRGSIRSILPQLGPDQFVRVHRNALVRRAAIHRVHRSSSGAVQIELLSGARIAAGRVYAKELADQIAASRKVRP